MIGGSSGIGLDVAVLAREIGAEVAIASSDAARLNSALELLPDATAHKVDLRDEGGVSQFFETLGGFDHLAITAGDWGGAMFSATKDIDIAAARDGFEVRFWGVLAVVKHAIRRIAENGSIELTSGMLGHRPMKGAPMATALGGAVEHLTKGLAVDLAPVRVNAVCPGLILTEHTRQMMPEEMRKGAVAGQPLPRGGEPREAATAYVYFMLNPYATGQILAVDGGGLLV